MTEHLPDPVPTDDDTPHFGVRHGQPDRTRDTQNAIRALSLRAQGYTLQQIADRLGYADKSGVSKVLERSLSRHEAENASELRALENHRLDLDELALRRIIASPSTTQVQRIRAIDARTRLSARRSRLNGLDAPVQVAVSGSAAGVLADALAEVRGLFVDGEVVESRELGPDET